MPRYFIELSYRGTAYHGWQIQINANSLQAELNKALSVLFKQSIETVGAGRTDAGVHAKQMFAHFDIASQNFDISDSFVHHLNCILPEDISVKRIFPVPKNAHARFDAISRTYEYIVYQNKNPFLRDFAYYVHSFLDMKIMNDAAKILLEYNDFSCFSKSNTQVLTNNCKITYAEWQTNKNNSVFTITSNRFLRNMVRAIVGTLLQIGQGKMGLNEFRNVIENKRRCDAGSSVPACGLYLVKIEYKLPT